MSPRPCATIHCHHVTIVVRVNQILVTSIAHGRKLQSSRPLPRHSTDTLASTNMEGCSSVGYLKPPSNFLRGDSGLRMFGRTTTGQSYLGKCTVGVYHDSVCENLA